MPTFRVDYSYDQPTSGSFLVEAETLGKAENSAMVYMEENTSFYIDCIEEIKV